MTAYYNENDPEAVAVLRELIASGIIAAGDVDSRSIKDVTADDIRGYAQCHFFAGAGLWSAAARLAGWPDDKPLWSASCPCQPWSASGRQGGADDPRHLWPDLYRIIRAARATGQRVPVLVGEQVAGSLGYGWFDGVRTDLARESIASRTIDIPACAVDAPHERNRLWWCAMADTDQSFVQGQPPARQLLQHEPHDGSGTRDPYADRPLANPNRLRQRQRPWRIGKVRRWNLHRHEAGDVVDAARERRRERWPAADVWSQEQPAAAGADLCQCGYPATPCNKGKHDYGHVCVMGDAERQRLERLGGHVDDRNQSGRVDAQSHRSIAAPDGRNGSWWADAEWIICHDGKARRAKLGIPMLVDGVVGRIAMWRLAGNSIVPQLAAEVLAAILETEADLT